MVGECHRPGAWDDSLDVRDMEGLGDSKVALKV